MWSADGSRIAIGMHDNLVQVVVLTAYTQLQSIYAGRLDNTVPKSLTFGSQGTVYIFGLYDGNV